MTSDFPEMRIDVMRFRHLERMEGAQFTTSYRRKLAFDRVGCRTTSEAEERPKGTSQSFRCWMRRRACFFDQQKGRVQLNFGKHLRMLSVCSDGPSLRFTTEMPHEMRQLTAPVRQLTPGNALTSSSYGLVPSVRVKPANQGKAFDICFQNTH